MNLKEAWNKAVDRYGGFVAAVVLVLLVAFAVVISQQRQTSFEGNFLRGWDCETSPALSISPQNSTQVLYRTSKGEWIYTSFGQGQLKNGKPFYSEFCSKGVPTKPPQQ